MGAEGAVSIGGEVQSLHPPNLCCLNWLQDAREADRPALASHLAPLLTITRSYLDGVSAHANEIGMTLFEAFLSVEERFQRGSEATEQEIIDDLRQARPMLVALPLLFAS